MPVIVQGTFQLIELFKCKTGALSASLEWMKTRMKDVDLISGLACISPSMHTGTLTTPSEYRKKVNSSVHSTLTYFFPPYLYKLYLYYISCLCSFSIVQP